MHMRGSRRGRVPSEKSQSNLVSWQYWSGSPENSQSYQASIKCWTIIGPPAKRPVLVFLDPPSPHPPPPPKKKFVKVGPSLTKLSGSAHDPPLATGAKGLDVGLSLFTSILCVCEQQKL